MNSNPAANGGIGTVGIWDYAGEHHRHDEVWIEANLPLVLTKNPQPEGLPATITSPHVEMSKNPPSHGMALESSGQCVLIAYDYHRPAIYIEQAHDVHLRSAYIGIRKGPNNAPLGSYLHAIEAHNVLRFSHQGMLEVPRESGYLKLAGAALNWDVNVFLGQQDPVNPDPAELKAAAQPVILLTASATTPAVHAAGDCQLAAADQEHAADDVPVPDQHRAGRGLERGRADGQHLRDRARDHRQDAARCAEEADPRLHVLRGLAQVREQELRPMSGRNGL